MKFTSKQLLKELYLEVGDKIYIDNFKNNPYTVEYNIEGVLCIKDCFGIFNKINSLVDTQLEILGDKTSDIKD
jgi:hypothetical protein